MLTGVDPSLDGAVVLLQDIIEVRHRPVLAAGSHLLGDAHCEVASSSIRDPIPAHAMPPPGIAP
jgi:hypothetical protein